MSYPSSQPSSSCAGSAGWNSYSLDDPSADDSPIISSTDTHKAPVFCLHNTVLTLNEEQNLKIHGYSAGDIKKSEKALIRRNITPSHREIFGHLQSGNGDTLGNIEKCIADGLSSTAGVDGKLRLLMEIQSYTRSCLKIATDNFNRHYFAFWPDRQKVVSMVIKWPNELKKQAAYVCKNWPELIIGNCIKVNFNSSISLCSNPLIKTLTPLDFQTFFRLVKDIWFDALSCNNTCTIERISHLLVSFAWEMSFNINFHPGPTRKRHERLEQAVLLTLQKGVSSTDDIDAFAFMLVTKPHIWCHHKRDVLQQMVGRAFNARHQKLSPLYAHWQEIPGSHESITRMVETEVIPDTAKAIHYLNDIHDYLMRHRDSHSDLSNNNQIHNGKYLVPFTNQLKSPILAPDLTISPTLEETGTALSTYFSFCRDHRHLSSDETSEDFMMKVPDTSKPGYCGLLETEENPIPKTDTKADSGTCRHHDEQPGRKRKQSKPSMRPGSFFKC